jgi:hypothetical protein
MEHHSHRGNPVGRRERLLARVAAWRHRADGRRPDPHAGAGQPQEDATQALDQVQEHR